MNIANLSFIDEMRLHAHYLAQVRDEDFARSEQERAQRQIVQVGAIVQQEGARQVQRLTETTDQINQVVNDRLAEMRMHDTVPQDSAQIQKLQEELRELEKGQADLQVQLKEVKEDLGVLEKENRDLQQQLLFLAKLRQQKTPSSCEAPIYAIGNMASKYAAKRSHES